MSGEPVDEVLVTAMAEAIHAAECTAYIHEGRNGVCERQARAAVPAVERILTDRLAAVKAAQPFTSRQYFIREVQRAETAEAAAASLRERLDRALTEHQPHPEQSGKVACPTCLLDYPCPTAAALGSGS